jgi:hypothetical protein
MLKRMGMRGEETRGKQSKAKQRKTPDILNKKQFTANYRKRTIFARDLLKINRVKRKVVPLLN